MKRFFIFTAAVVYAAISMAGTQVTKDCGTQVTIRAVPETGYHFVRWSDDNTEAERSVVVTANATYRAYFAINQYTITFKNWNDTVLQTGVYTHGDAVTAPVATKTADAQYTYTFDHWSPNVNYTAEADAEYTAVFSETLNQYTITFKNWNGDTLESKKWNYGVLPSLAETPTRPSDAGHTYTFTGWDHTVSLVTGEDTYVAQYDETKKSFELTLAATNGTVTGAGTYQYGTEVPITATASSCYHFVKWSDNDTNANRTVTITGTTHLEALFEINTYTLEVVSDDESQGKTVISE